MLYHPNFAIFVCFIFQTIANTVARGLPYADFRMPNQFLSFISNVFCTRSIRLDMCELVHFFLMGGNPQNVFNSNTDAVSKYLMFLGLEGMEFFFFGKIFF